MRYSGAPTLPFYNHFPFVILPAPGLRWERSASQPHRMTHPSVRRVEEPLLSLPKEPQDHVSYSCGSYPFHHLTWRTPGNKHLP